MSGALRVLITGGGSGLGAALAHAWSEAGWRVAVSDIDAARAERTRAALANADDCIAFELNVSSAADFDRAVELLDETMGGVDVVVNNAGVATAGTVRSTPLAEWDRLLDINVMGVVRGCRAFVPQMTGRGSGHIVNIASFAAIANAPGLAAYNVAKSGVVSLSESLRAEVEHHGVGVSVVCPAFFPTDLVASMHGQSEEVKKLTNKLMEASGVTAADVAADILRAVEKRRFLVITHRDARLLYRLKRWLPALFHRLLIRQTRGLLPQE